MNQRNGGRFLLISLIAVILLTVSLFSFLAVNVNHQSLDAIEDVGKIYMNGISEQSALHFRTTIEVRLEQIQSIVHIVPQSLFSDRQALLAHLELNAEARGYEYMALFDREGHADTVFGGELTPFSQEIFQSVLQADEPRIFVGSTPEAGRLFLFSVPSQLPMTDGDTSTILVGGMPVDYVSTLLFPETEAPMVLSYIIRKDGSYVLRSNDHDDTTYFDQLYALFADQDAEDIQRHIQELTDAMSRDEDYTTLIESDSARRNLYCTALPYSDWYWITVLPFDSIRTVITAMSHNWIIAVYSACAIVLLTIALLFLQYFQRNRRQLRDLEESWMTAQAAQQTAESALEVAESSQRAAETAEREARKANKAKSEFLSNMSHDIRTPMNAIVGMTAIAIANIDNKEQVQNCLKKITLSSKHLLGLINDVLDMSKIESGKMTLTMDRVSLREVMDSIVSIVQPQIKAKDQQFNVFIHDISAENIYCDSVRLNQILLNFLSNAIKFTPEGGSIQLALYEEPSAKGEGYVRIHLHVKDNGIGMSQEFKDRIFESFTREDSTRVHKTEGTGLGMAITKYIVTAMGGTIEVDSEQGKGTEFRVTLDMEKAEAPEEEMILPDWNMLVVDDDKQLCESAVSSLLSIGIQAEWTLSGEDAVRMVEERHARRDDYQIILLDWRLPGMDGISTAKEIRRRLGRAVPILLISAYDWADIEDEAREAGINGFISKPLFKSTLFHGLRPFATIPGEEELPEAPGPLMDFSGKRILLAEDNDLNWEIAEELLTAELNVTLEWAENGQICVEKFKQSPTGYYDAILMDIRMPVMTGYEATWAIRALDRPDSKIPIIAMTADAFSDDIKRCLDCGMNAHISKPIDVREVARLLKKYLME